MSNTPYHNINQTPPSGGDLAVYIHWPFCLSKCPYCDFNSHVRERIDQERWKEALLLELDYMGKQVPHHKVRSIFFGGGTPSLMPAATVQALIDHVHRLWPVDATVEITLEANPTSVEIDTFKHFKQAGINRVSLGVQSLRDEELQFLGRGHNASEALAAIESARMLFDRYSFDLIYARPKQTLADWEKELGEALALAGGHLSLYQLTIEENTAFHHAYAKGGFILPNEEEAEALYRLTESMMNAHGLMAYEVSNYAAPGHESRHNLSYWQGGDYIGVGPGAHGRITQHHRYEPTASHMGQSSRLARSNDHDTVLGRIATQILKSPERWLEQVERQGHAIEIWQPIERQQEAQERLMMGLRLREGIKYQDFKNQTGYDLKSYINQAKSQLYKAQGLLVDDADSVCVTLAGRLVLNHLTAELLL